jgi:RNA-dependent RNA polymerase
MTTSMLLCSPPKVPEVLQVCWALVGGHYATASIACLYFPKGDYDGDTVTCIWQPSIVGEFSNADPKHMEPPASLQDHFHIKNESVNEFLQRVPPTCPIESQIQEIQGVMMNPLSDVHVVGTYSTMHENAIYGLGYDDPTTTLLAWM